MFSTLSYGQNSALSCAKLFTADGPIKALPSDEQFPDARRHYKSNQVSYGKANSPVPGSSAVGFIRSEERETAIDSPKGKVGDDISYRDPTYLTIRETSFVEDPFVSTTQPQDLKAGTQAFAQLLDRFMNTVMRVYESRRARWTPELKAKLRADAIKYAARTKFTMVSMSRKVEKIISGPLVHFSDEHADIGTIRTIYAHENPSGNIPEDLPMEDSLKINLPFNGGVKVEAGSFTIDKYFNKPVFGELIVSLVRDAQNLIGRPNHEVNKPVIYTYADPASLEMYTSKTWGFVPVPGIAPIQYAGSKWVVISSTAENLTGMPSRLAESRKYWDPIEAAVFEYVLSYFDMVKSKNRSQHQSHEGIGSAEDILVWNYTTYQSRVTDSPEQDWAHRSEYRNIAISIGESQGKRHFGLTIPVDNLPLVDDKPQWDRSYTYKNGVLSYPTTSLSGEKQIIEIETDPYVVALNSIRIKVLNQSGVQTTILSFDLSN